MNYNECTVKLFFVAGIFVLTIFVFAGESFIPKNEPVNTIFEGSLRTLSLGSTMINVAIADTEQARRKGLSNLPALPQGHGLFFVFEESGTYGIWMKNMKFPIDIIWMGTDMQVVDIHRNISPGTYPTSFYSRVPARFVLEVGAGFSLLYNIEIGSVGSFEES